MRIAIYPGSFDPVTFGHLDIIKRAALAFDKLIVAVGYNQNKKGLFDPEYRAELIRREVKRLNLPRPNPMTGPNIEVVAFQGLLADFAYEKGAQFVVKGVRPNGGDFSYETLLHQISITQQRGIDTHILIAREELSHISSSAVKELALHQGLLHEYVPLRVKQAVELLTPQLIVGVTGAIASGKSTLCETLADRKVGAWSGEGPGLRVYNIDLDKIAHGLLDPAARPEPAYEQLRENIREHFQLSKLTRKALGDVVFIDDKARAELNEMMRVPILTRVRREMLGKKGVILLNGALLVEAGYLPLCNNHVVVVKTSPLEQENRLKARGLTPKQMERRLEAQLTSEQKANEAMEAMKRDGFGRVIMYESFDRESPSQNHRAPSDVLELICKPFVAYGLEYWTGLGYEQTQAPQVFEQP